MTRLLTMLQERTGLNERSLLRIIATAPERYKVYTIPKRSGGRREIAHPASELKALQRALVDAVLSARPVHPAAMAYVKGKSIRTNATAHVTNGPILKFDFAQFFPSITHRDWRLYCSEHEIFETTLDIHYSSKILFQRPRGGRILRLSIGAPSSPQLSNVLMYNFDRLLSERVAQDFVTYTRYADDLTFSAERTGYLNSVEKALTSTMRDILYPRLTLNDQKTVMATKKFHRQVTGLVLTLDGRISLGRDRKRLIRARLHHFSLGKLNDAQILNLAGTLAFAKDMEPDFYTRLVLHYGDGIFKTLGERFNGIVHSSET